MRMTAGLSTLQSVSPQMVASATILQCGAQELAEYLEELSYENPLMDLQEPELTEHTRINAAVDKLRWLRGCDYQNRSYYRDSERDSVDQYLHIVQDTHLKDFVLEQVLTLNVSSKLRHVIDIILELLDDRGLFSGEIAEIAELSCCPEAMAEEALRIVRSLEPVGVAAESVQQALLRQLERLEKPVALRMIREHFAHLSVWSDQRIAREMGISKEAVVAAKKLVSALRPYPSYGFADQENIQYVTPDISILPEGGILKATVEESYLPTVHINARYLAMLQNEQNPEVQAYLTEKLHQLEQVIGNLGRRKSTLLRCGEVIASRQEEFFQGGLLRTLTMKAVAEELGLHESTICRAVKNKYVQCSRGLFPMSAFFSRDVGQNVGVSRSSIQMVVAQIIGGENPESPLSDEKITAELAKKRICLSRRAVAKYRMELGIPAASARKRKS